MLALYMVSLIGLIWCNLAFAIPVLDWNVAKPSSFHFAYIATEANQTMDQSLPSFVLNQSEDTIRLSSKYSKDIKLDFTVQDTSRDLKFEYRVVPEDDFWSKATTNTIHLSIDDPGFYQLIVRSKDEENHIEEHIKYLEIKPVWWQTSIANTLFSIFFLILLGGMLQYFRFRE